jgi:MFS-type transporter involved in bile tolerance (Atg22 family)
MVATITAWFDSQRAGFASLASLMILGGFMLMKVRQERATVAR